MSEYEKGRQAGLRGGWDPHADLAGQLEGQKQREQEDAAWRNRNSGGGGGGGGGQEEGAGLILLMAIVGAGVLIFSYRFALLSLAYGVLLTAVAVFAFRRGTGHRASAWAALRSAALAYGFALLAVALSVLVSRFIAQSGLDLTPGLELFTDYGAVISTGPQSYILPVLAWIIAGSWWLNRSQSGAIQAVALRWAAAAATMLLTPWLGLELARGTFALF